MSMSDRITEVIKNRSGLTKYRNSRIFFRIYFGLEGSNNKYSP